MLAAAAALCVYICAARLKLLSCWLLLYVWQAATGNGVLHLQRGGIPLSLVLGMEQPPWSLTWEGAAGVTGRCPREH